MGLDMYLYAEKGNYSNYDFQREREREAGEVSAESKEFDKIISALGLTRTIKNKALEVNHLSVSVQVGYWRKANAIHSYFVREFADGVDECQRIDVSREGLEILATRCREILATVVKGEPEKHTDSFWGDYETVPITLDEDLARTLLEPQSGFFFGSTDYDEGYVADLERTVEMIDVLLDKFPDWEFHYHASW